MLSIQLEQIWTILAFLLPIHAFTLPFVFPLVLAVFYDVRLGLQTFKFWEYSKSLIHVQSFHILSA
jgi:hypothetical protein